MQVVDTFGRFVERYGETDSRKARRLLKTGWEMQRMRLQLRPEQRLFASDKFQARLMMDAMLYPLKHPDESALVSVFTPCELLQEVGLHPYNVEGFSCYLSASHAERGFLQHAEGEGISETLCSYHKTFLGAAQRGVLPKPRCIVYTNLACDANLVTFRRLSELYGVPAFAIDVPMQQNEANVAYVADTLRQMSEFLQKHTGKTVDEDRLRKRLRRSKRTLENFQSFQRARADRYIPSDLVTPLYSGMTLNLLLGTPEEEQYTQMCRFVKHLLH